MIGSAGDSSQEHGRLTLEQIDHEPAVIYELPSGDIAVVVPVQMTVTSRVLITELEMTTALDDLLLDLSDPEEIPYYEDLISPLPFSSPILLNKWLTHNRALDICREEGMIVAHGWSSVPSVCQDDTPVAVELYLRDQRGYELRFGFETRVDRSVKHKYEPRMERRHESAQLELRRGLRRPSSSDTQRISITHRALQRWWKSKEESARTL